MDSNDLKPILTDFCLATVNVQQHSRVEAKRNGIVYVGRPC